MQISLHINSVSWWLHSTLVWVQGQLTADAILAVFSRLSAVRTSVISDQWSDCQRLKIISCVCKFMETIFMCGLFWTALDNLMNLFMSDRQTHVPAWQVSGIIVFYNNRAKHSCSSSLITAVGMFVISSLLLLSARNLAEILQRMITFSKMANQGLLSLTTWCTKDNIWTFMWARNNSIS